MTDRTQTDLSILDAPQVSRVLFHPRKAAGPPDAKGRLPERMIPVAEGIRVGSRFYLCGPGHPVILFFHGNGEIAEDYDAIAPLFTKANLNLVVADYRGYGRSAGSPTVSTLLSDCHQILAFVKRWKETEDYPGPLVVMGRSLGSASALELAASCGEDIDGLVIESGFAWAGPLLRLLGLHPNRLGLKADAGFSQLDKIRSFAKPTLILHAEFDHIIPHSDGQALYDASGAKDKTLVTIAGANHNDIFLRGLDRYMDAVCDLAHNRARRDPGEG